MSLRAIRLSKEISKERIAKNLGIHVNTYAKWERNPENIPIDRCVEICDILDIKFETDIFLPKKAT